MSLHDRYAALPTRLHGAVRIWLAIGLLSAVLPAAAANQVGVLAQPWFWAGLLPLLVLAPYRRALMSSPQQAKARRG